MNTTNDSCTNATFDTDFDHLSEGRVFIIVLLCILSVLTVAGNTILILAILASKRLRNRPNTFVLSRAVADLGVGCVVMPLSIYRKVALGRWYFGDEACMLSFSASVFFSSASIHHLLMIAVHRYIVICHPAVHKRMQSWKVFTMLASCWVIPALISFLPIMNYWHLLGLEDSLPCFPAEYRNTCSMITNTAYAYIVSFLMFYIPGVVMIFCHIKLRATTKMRVDHFRKFSIISAELNDVNMAHTLSVLMVCFGLCWTLFFVCALVHPLVDYNIPFTFWAVIFWMGCCNSMLSPFVYYLSSATFRYNIHQLITCDMCNNRDAPPRGSSDTDDVSDLPRMVTKIEPREPMLSPMEEEPMETQTRKTVTIAP